jgi:hypothetical protein
MAVRSRVTAGERPDPPPVWVQTHCWRGSMVVGLRCMGLSLVVGLPVWVCGRGSPVHGSFFGCGFADEGLRCVGLFLVVVWVYLVI